MGVSGMGVALVGKRQRPPAQSVAAAQGSPLSAPITVGLASHVPPYGLHRRGETHAGSPAAGISAQPGKHPRLSIAFESQKKHSPL